MTCASAGNSSWTARVSRILDGWSVEKAKRMGASAAKLLVHYHPDAANAADQEALVARVAAECRDADLALFVEPLSFSLVEGEKLTGDGDPGWYDAPKASVATEATAAELARDGIEL